MKWWLNVRENSWQNDEMKGWMLSGVNVGMIKNYYKNEGKKNPLPWYSTQVEDKLSEVNRTDFIQGRAWWEGKNRAPSLVSTTYIYMRDIKGSKQYILEDCNTYIADKRSNMNNFIISAYLHAAQVLYKYTIKLFNIKY